MQRGITFATRDEAREYANTMRRQGWITAINYQPETKVYIVTIGKTARELLKEEVPTEIPLTAYEALEMEEEAKEEAAEMATEVEAEAAGQEEWEAEQKKRKEEWKAVGKYAGRAAERIAAPIEEDIRSSLARAKQPPHVKAGMMRAVPPRPYTAEHLPRIGIVGAVGVKTPRIGRISRVGAQRVSFPRLENGRIPPRARFQAVRPGAKFQAPRSRIAQLTPVPKPSYPYFRSEREREEENR